MSIKQAIARSRMTTKPYSLFRTVKDCLNVRSYTHGDVMYIDMPDSTGYRLVILSYSPGVRDCRIEFDQCVNGSWVEHIRYGVHAVRAALKAIYDDSPMCSVCHEQHASVNGLCADCAEYAAHQTLETATQMTMADIVAEFIYWTSPLRNTRREAQHFINLYANEFVYRTEYELLPSGD